MPVSIEDVYRHASESGKWRFALINTQVIDDTTGEVKKPTSELQRDDLTYKLSKLRPYANSESYIKLVVTELEANIEAFALAQAATECVDIHANDDQIDDFVE